MSCEVVNRRKLNVNLVIFMKTAMPYTQSKQLVPISLSCYRNSEKYEVSFSRTTFILVVDRSIQLPLDDHWVFVVTVWLCIAASWFWWCAFDRHNEVKQNWAGLTLEWTVIFGITQHLVHTQSSMLSSSAYEYQCKLGGNRFPLAELL